MTPKGTIRILWPETHFERKWADAVRSFEKLNSDQGRYDIQLGNEWNGIRRRYGVKKGGEGERGQLMRNISKQKMGF